MRGDARGRRDLRVPSPKRNHGVGLELYLHLELELDPRKLKLQRTLSTDRVTQLVPTGTVADF